MKICHTQPHLVPPMRLVVYDDLPSPGPPPRTASLPSWVVNEGRQLASRASSRASMSFKRKSTAPLRISAPTDFRRIDIDPFEDSDEFQPLELSIHTPKNRLSNLPSFENFGIQEERQYLPARPPRVLSPSADIPRSRSHRPSHSFQLPRKPVGSGSRRSSLATLEQLLERQQSPMASPLIPHFSSRPSTTAGPADNLPSPAPTRLDSPGDFGGLFNTERRRRTDDAEASTFPRTPTNLQDRPFTSMPPPEEESSSIDSPRTPTACPDSPNTTPSRAQRSGRVTQWLFPGSNKNGSPQSSPLKSACHDKATARTRTRTLSGSTLASSLSSITGNFKITPSFSSGLAASPTFRSDSRRGKEFDLPISRPIPITSFEERAYPTIYEGQQQPPQQEYQDSVYKHYARQRESAVGVAF
ncbi:hypothetical protein AWENTII_006977 [Aspergillus wentii]|nr:hypothetical protein MW887_004220 [Aspergillus wentii]